MQEFNQNQSRYQSRLTSQAGAGVQNGILAALQQNGHYDKANPHGQVSSAPSTIKMPSGIRAATDISPTNTMAHNGSTVMGQR